mmetsp:Transcript_44623/g.125936  ORF Transcript_44623/g.125936 Transcript_44623/m.125936 type:complete len:240 (-) Transcript_44623:197-916(-)
MFEDVLRNRSVKPSHSSSKCTLEMQLRAASSGTRRAKKSACAVRPTCSVRLAFGGDIARHVSRTGSVAPNCMPAACTHWRSAAGFESPPSAAASSAKHHLDAGVSERPGEQQASVATALSASLSVRPVWLEVRTKRPRRRQELGEVMASRSMSSIATQSTVPGCRSNHLVISAARPATLSMTSVQSLTGASPRRLSISSKIATFAHSCRQVLERTIAAPVTRRIRSNCAQQLSTNTSSP